MMAKKNTNLYLICAADRLETAFFCGDSRECTQLLGLASTAVFFSALCKGTKVMNFFKIEKVRIREE